jgi:pilus assembly protein CpaC
MAVAAAVIYSPGGGLPRRAELWAILLLAVILFLFATDRSRAQEEFVRFQTPGQVVSLRVSPSKSTTIRTNVAFADIVVGNPDIADVQPLTTMSLYILGKSAGRTNVAFYNAQKDLIGVVDLAVGVDLGELNAAIRDAAPYSRVRASVANSRIRLSGTVPDGVTLQTVLQVTQDFTSDPVINTIRVLDSQQVLLEVRIIEANRSAGRDLGISWAVRDGANRGAVIGINTTPPTTSPSVSGMGGTGVTAASSAPFGTIVANVISGGVDVDIVIRALEQKNLARRLAEPNLIALSGQTASFLAGGEFPVTTIDDEGRQDVTFKQFGVLLTFTPTVLDDGLINLVLSPEVSDVNTALTVNGVPSLTTRKATTTVELHDGQSFAIAGLLQAVNEKTQDQLPWLGQVPVLGALFRSSSFQKRQTDLVVVVTPHIVRPARPGEPLKTPLDNTRPSNDTEFFLLGLLEVTPQLLSDFANGKGVVGPYGHIVDLPGDTTNVVTKP